MTRENMYRDLYNHTVSWLRLDLDEVGGCLASGRDGGEADAYTEAFGSSPTCSAISSFWRRT